MFLDRRLMILFFCIFCYVLFIMGRSISFHWLFIFLTMVFNSFHCLYGTTESYNATLVERHGFQEKNAYRLRNLGGILTLFIQSWIPFKKSGTAFSDFSFSRSCSLFFSDFSFSRCCSLFFSDFSLFSRCASLFLIDVSMSLHVFHYFSVFFQCFRDVFHYFSISVG